MEAIENLNHIITFNKEDIVDEVEGIKRIRIGKDSYIFVHHVYEITGAEDEELIVCSFPDKFKPIVYIKGEEVIMNINDAIRMILEEREEKKLISQ